MSFFIRIIILTVHEFKMTKLAFRCNLKADRL
jgi:hypothetical protein